MMPRPLPSGLAPGTPEVPAVASEIAAFQVQAYDAEQALSAVKSFREPWERFVPTLRAIVQASAGKSWPIDDALQRPRILLADTDRLKLKNLLGNLAVVTDPLAQLLRTTLIQPFDGLYHVIGKRVGSTITHEIDSDRFEMVIAESDGILNEAEQRLAAQRDRAHQQAAFLQRQLDAQRAHELERLEREHLSFKALWKQLTRTTVGKVVTWAVVTLLAGILTTLGVPALIKIILWIQSAIRS